jgi:hypothetical protein
MASRVELDPAPAITGTLPRAAATTARTTSACSSWDNVGDSPVVPAGDIPSMPLLTW